ncbi:phage tail tape measure protein, partial [Bacillus cereus]
MKEALEGTKISADQLEKWGKSVAKGGKEGSAAMTEIAKALVSIEDETKRNEIGVKLFGTMYEDQGQNITNTLIGAQGKVI